MDVEVKIQELLNSFSKRNQIEWRVSQRETIEELCLDLYQGKSDIILDAPTGAGKSLIAMASSIILRGLNKEGYIIVSDNTLMDQYIDDLGRLRTGIPAVKGADNYICDDNGQKVTFGSCNLKKQNKRRLECYASCPYYSRRDKTIEEPFSLLNYSYWLIQMNYVNLRHAASKSFDVRDVVFLDEAHKLDMIIHNHFAPRINDSLVNSLLAVEHKIFRVSSKVNELITAIRRCNNNIELMSLLKELKNVLAAFCDNVKMYLDSYHFSSTPSVEEIGMLNNFDRIKDVFCKIQDFEELVVEDPQLITKTIDSNEINLNYLDSQQMLSVFFQKYTKQRVFMSATWGNLEKSAGFLGISSYKHIKMNNNFDYSKSTYKVIGKHSLTYTNRDKQLAGAIRDLDEILEKYPDKKGLIHTGSYQFADAIINGSKFANRFTIYRSSEEKSRALLEHNITEKSIILGASLLEGINLPDELCEFIIFFKCPYLGLSSDFVKKKTELYPSWYAWKCSLSIEQGVGRGMRHMNDNCDVWFIDQSFIKFFHQNSHYMSDEFLDRVLDPLDRLLL